MDGLLSKPQRSDGDKPLSSAVVCRSKQSDGPSPSVCSHVSVCAWTVDVFAEIQGNASNHCLCQFRSLIYDHFVFE